MWNNFLKVMFNLPFILFIALTIFLCCFIGLTPVLWIQLVNAVLLLVIGLGLSSDNNFFKIISYICMIIYLVISIIIGSYEYFRWASVCVSLFVIIYYLIILFFKNIIRKN